MKLKLQIIIPLLMFISLNAKAGRPEITLTGRDTIVTNICDTFMDPGAQAMDSIDGNITSKIHRIGAYTNHVAGNYLLKYYAVNSNGDTGWASRLLIVRDIEKPHIRFRGTNITDQMVVIVQLNSIFIDSVIATDGCMGAVPLSKVNGYNGAVKSSVRALYPVNYFAKDNAGNKAAEDSFTIIYKVDDFIAPVISSHAADTTCHQINTPFKPDSVTVTDNYYPKNQISLVVKNQVDPYKAGDYTVTYTATDPSGNVVSLVKIIRVGDCNASVKNPNSEASGFRVFPNPAHNQFAIACNGVSGPVTLSIRSLTGASICEIKVPDFKQEYVVNFDSKTPGMYIVELKTNQTLFSTKIVLQ